MVQQRSSRNCKKIDFHSLHLYVCQSYTPGSPGSTLSMLAFVLTSCLRRDMLHLQKKKKNIIKHRVPSKKPSQRESLAASRDIVTCKKTRSSNCPLYVHAKQENSHSIPLICARPGMDADV
jgi:hypothetical protein